MKKENAPFKKNEQSAKVDANYNMVDKQLHLPGFECPFAEPALWPNPQTLAWMVLQRLLAGEELRQDDFEPSWRLAAIVFGLVEAGWAMSKRRVNSPGRVRPIAAYRLDFQAAPVQAAISLRGGMPDAKGSA